MMELVLHPGGGSTIALGCNSRRGKLPADVGAHSSRFLWPSSTPGSVRHFACIQQKQLLWWLIAVHDSDTAAGM